MADASPAWAVAAPDALLWRSWDEQDIVFHRASGETHRLHPLAGEALRLLAAAPYDAAALAERLAALFEVDADDDFRARVGALIGELDTLGLIAPVAP